MFIMYLEPNFLQNKLKIQVTIFSQIVSLLCIFQSAEIYDIFLVKYFSTGLSSSKLQAINNL